uniref:Citrate synthase n=1 Tax=Myxobolus squamalis TaxID=59785 RepID=A0A6B2FZ08_MYXSQ
MEPINANCDWSKNYTRMLGINNDRKFIDYMRLYLSIHSDHEGGNVSCHTAYLVGSTLSDIYLSFSAAVNGLAGPLHGRANQEVVEWIRDMTAVLGENNLNDESITKYCQKAIEEGVIPGFGHAILRITDPRYTIIRKFAEENLPNNLAINMIDKLNIIVSKILQEGKKAKNPQPNVDCISGTVLNVFLFLNVAIQSN